MVMRSIPELLHDSSSHVSIAVPKHLKEGSPAPSSSSDSDEDIQELPFIPMPLNLGFSGLRVSLTDIPAEGEAMRKANGSPEAAVSASQGQEPMECEPTEKDKEGEDKSGRGRARKRSTQDEEKGSSDEEPGELPQRVDHPKRPLRRGSSMDSDKPEGASRRRGELRRGGSADSALLLRINPEDGAKEGGSEDGKRVLKKAVSMELPRRSASPGTGNMSQEDYALKLELMRQRLLRGGRVDNKMSGLRGPLIDTLGMGDDRRLSRRMGAPPLVRAASSEDPREDIPKTKVLRKSASFSQGDTEPIPLYRRMGAPLEIPLAQIEERRLQEAVSMSALAEPRPVTPKPPTPEPVRQDIASKKEEGETEKKDSKLEEEVTKMETEVVATGVGDDQRVTGVAGDSRVEEAEVVQKVIQRTSTPSMVQRNVIEEKIEEVDEEEEEEEEDEERKEEVKDERTMYAAETDNRMDEEEVHPPVRTPEIPISSSSIMLTPTPARVPTSVVSTYVTPSPPSHVVLPDGRLSAYASIMQTIATPANQPASGSAAASAPDSTQILSSVPVYAPISTTVPEPTQAVVATSRTETLQTQEHAAVFSRVASTEHLPNEPSPPKTPTSRRSPMRETTPGEDNIKDIASEEVFEARFKKRESSLTRSFKLLSRQKPEERPVAVSTEDVDEQVYRPGVVGAPLELASRRLEEKSKSVQDLREAQKDPGFMRRLSMRLRRTPSEERKKEKAEEEDPSTPRRRLSWALGRRGSQEKKEVEMVRMDGGVETPTEPESVKKPSESPVLAMRKKIGSTVAGISMRIRSFSEERKTKTEEARETRRPLLSILRRSSTGASSESLDSVSSIQSESTAKGMNTHLFPISLPLHIYIYVCLRACECVCVWVYI